MQTQPDPRILVVEDDEATGTVICKLLFLKLSADVTLASDCTQAREKLASMTFDLVTLDYQLPDGDGLQILGEIASHENHPPVLMVTGHGYEQTAVDAFTESTAHLGRWSLSAEHVFEGEPLFMPHQEYLPLDEVRRMEGLHFLAGVPLRYGGEVFGNFNVASHSLDDIPENMKRVIEGLAGLVDQTVGRARLMAALQASEKRYGLLYENIGQPGYTFDTNMIMTDLNRKAIEMLGYASEELLGKNVFEVGILRPENVETAVGNAGLLLSGQKVVSNRYSFIRKDGQLLPVNVTSTALRDENGEIVGVTSVGIEITE